MKLSLAKIALGLGAIALISSRKKQPPVLATWRLLRSQGDYHSVHTGDLVTLELEIIERTGSRSRWSFRVIAEKNKGDCSVYDGRKLCTYWTGTVANISWPADFNKKGISPLLPVTGQKIEFENEQVLKID